MPRRFPDIVLDGRDRFTGIRLQTVHQHTNIRVLADDRDALADFQTALRATRGHHVSLADAFRELLRANEARILEEARRAARAYRAEGRE
ncbi:MAG: hypothetical protein ACYDCK_08660 [Thermoplasmatota archaeon]